MNVELVSIETNTHPLEGAFYAPEGGARDCAILFMHGNCCNFYSGVPREFSPLLAKQGFAVLAYNRRGHDILTTTARRATGGAYQRIHEMIEDNKIAETWLVARGYSRLIVIGHSNGGMLAVRHCADNPNVHALALLSAHMGGKELFRTISKAGLMAGERFEEFSARARTLVTEGKGGELMLMPGWWWVISADTFVDYLDVCPDILQLAPQVRCPVLFLRGDQEARHIYPGEAFVERAGGQAEFTLVPDCDHFYEKRETTVAGMVEDWLVRSGI